MIEVLISKRNSRSDVGFGYQLVGQPRHVAIEKCETSIVLRAFVLCASGCRCLKSIQHAIRTEFNVEISVRNLRWILRDDRYLGLTISDGHIYLREDLAIVDLKTYKLVQHVLGPRKNRGVGKNPA